MPDRAEFDDAFDTLLCSLTATWSAADVAYIRDEVEHHEYGDALENLLELAMRQGMGLSGSQHSRVIALAADLGLQPSPIFRKFLAADRPTARVG